MWDIRCNFVFDNFLGAAIRRALDVLVVLDRKYKSVSDAILAEGVAAFEACCTLDLFITDFAIHF